MEISSKSTNPVRGHSQWINLCACCWLIFHLLGCSTCNELGWGSPQHSLNNRITGWSLYQIWHAKISWALGEDMRSLYYLVLLARRAGSLYSSVYQLMLSKSKTKFCLGEYFRVVEAQYWGPMKKAKKRKKAKILKKEFRESCSAVFYRPTDEETFWKIHANNYKIFFVSYKLNRPWWQTDI